MVSRTEEERVLVEKAVTGDANAFGDLYEIHVDAIFRYVYYRTGQIHDAEDLTEQIFLKAWEALSNYKDYGNPFSSWLYRIAHNIVVDYHRQRKSIPTSLNALPIDIEENEPSAPLGQVIRKEEFTILADAISRLPLEHQQIIVLRFVEGLSHAEIARIIGKNEGTCRMIQHRALIALQTFMNGAGGDVNE
jgi:RNA polymerase sigma-70 factor, ECF subfamily